MIPTFTFFCNIYVYILYNLDSIMFPTRSSLSLPFTCLYNLNLTVSSDLISCLELTLLYLNLLRVHTIPIFLPSPSVKCLPYVFIVQCIQPTLLYLSLHVHPSFPSLSSRQCLPDVFIIQYVLPLPALLYLSIYMSILFQFPFLQLLCNIYYPTISYLFIL